MKWRNIKPIEWFVLIFFTFVFMFIIACTWMWFYPYKILEPISFAIDQPTVTAGEDVTYTFVYSKYLPVPARVLKRLENHIVVPYQDIYTNMPIGQHLVHRGTLHIPSSACKGSYRVAVDFLYAINPLRTITVSMVSDAFTVKRPVDVPRR
jgi:hypothetical protein